MIDRADLAALLVDHDERPPVPRLLDLPGQPAPLGAVAAVLTEQDHAGGLARAKAAADVLGPSGARKARDRDLADLLAERHAIDRLERDGELPLLGRIGGRGALSARVVPRADALHPQ